MKNLHILAIFLFAMSYHIEIEAQNFEKAKLDEYFQTLCDNNKFMGNVSIFHDSVEIYSISVGYADIETQIKNTEFSKNCVGSISKTFTAVMIFQAIDEGKLSLNETLNKYFPIVKNAERITIGHLLGHRSGIHSFTEDREFMQWTAKTREQMVEIIMAGGSDFEPDTSADYSNSGYVLLSYILEDIYGKSYADILRDNITRPLSLKNTYFGKNTIDINDNECNSYLYSDRWQVQTVTDPSITLGAGCIISTSKDLNEFADALFNGKLISTKSLSTMQNIREDFGGMGLFPAPYFSKQGYGHRGGIDGFNSMFIYMPKDKISYAITSNGLNYNFTEIHATVLNCIYGQQFDIPDFEKVNLKSKKIENYIGNYINNSLPIEVTVSRNSTSLLAQVTGQHVLPLEAMSEHVFRFTENDITIIFNSVNKTMILIKEDDIFYFEKK